MTATDFRQQATDLITAKFAGQDYLTAGTTGQLAADAVAALEPVFADIDAQLGRNKFAETLEDARDVAVGGVKDGVKLIQENLKSDGPLMSGATDILGKAGDFLSKAAKDARAKHDTK